MTFHLSPQPTAQHVSVKPEDFKETLATLRVQAYKQDKDASLAAQNKAQRLLEENKNIQAENKKLKAENERLKAKIKKLQNPVVKLK